MTTIKLWLVLYTSNGIGVVWGPLPYGMDECLRRATERQTAVSKMIETGIGETGKKLPPDVIHDLKSWTLKCEEHTTRPERI